MILLIDMTILEYISCGKELRDICFRCPKAVEGNLKRNVYYSTDFQIIHTI